MTNSKASRPIELVISDCDGTLFDPSKEVTPRARRAVEALRSKGIRFTLSSSRPPSGIATAAALLEVSEPMGTCNGAAVVDASLIPLVQHCLEPADVALASQILTAHSVDAWAYSASGWWVTDTSNRHVAKEASNLRLEPTVVSTDRLPQREILKIVGVCDDVTVVRDARAAIKEHLGDRVHAECSQDYYLDVTSSRVSKGTCVEEIARLTNVDQAAIAVLGDGHNDVAMFAAAGLSIAMGQSDERVRSAADQVTTSNADEGFARAIEQLIIPR